MNNSLRVLMESMNAQIQSLISNGYQIYDADNRDYFISGVSYSKEDDKIIFETVEDKTKKEDEE